MTYQSVTIVGNVGRDPELRYTPQGSAVTDFSVAVNEVFTANGERRERTTWWRVTCWNRQAETVAQYLKKGRQVLVVGRRVEANAYTGKDGEARATLELTADTVQFLGGRDDRADVSEGGYDSRNDFAPPPSDQVDDIPF